MSFQEDEITLYIKGSNIAEVAQFATTTDNIYLSFYPNNCNNFLIDDYTKSIIFGASNYNTFYRAYISSTSNDNIKNIISFDENNVISFVNFIPNNDDISLGNNINKWKDLYISSNIYISDVKITGLDSNLIIDGDLKIDNQYVNNLINTKRLITSNIFVYSNLHIYGNTYANDIISSNTIITNKLVLSNIETSLFNYGDINTVKLYANDTIYVNNLYNSNNAEIIGSINTKSIISSNIQTDNLYSSNITVYDILQTKKLISSKETYFGGNINIIDDFISTSNSYYNIGSANKKWKDIYVSSNIYIGNTHLSFYNSNIILYGDLYSYNLISSNLVASNITLLNQKIALNVYGDIISDSFINSNTIYTNDIITSNELKVFNLINTNNINNTGVIEANYIENTGNNIGLNVYNLIKSRELITSNIYTSNLLASNVNIINNLLTNDLFVSNIARFNNGLILNNDLLPNVSSTYDIGSETNKFRNIYINSNIYLGGTRIHSLKNNLNIEGDLYVSNIKTSNIISDNILLNNDDSFISVSGYILSKDIINCNAIYTNTLIVSNVDTSILNYGDIVSENIIINNDLTANKISTYSESGLTVYGTAITNTMQSSNIKVDFINTSNIHVIDTVYTSNLTVSDELKLLGDIVISGDIIPGDTITFDLGSDTHKWKDLYLSDGSLYLGDTKITGEMNGIKIINLTNDLHHIRVKDVILQGSSPTDYITISVDDNGLLTFTNQDGNNKLGLLYNEIANRPFNYISENTLYSSNNYIFNGSLISSNTILYGKVGINTNTPNANLDINGTLYADSIQGSFIGDGYGLSNLNVSNIIGILSVSQGGTGRETLPYGQLIVGNNEGPVITTPELIWDDTTKLLAVDGTIVSSYAQSAFSGDGINLSNIDSAKIVGVINIDKGGTGCNIIPEGHILVGNNQDSLITTPNFTWDNITHKLSIKGDVNVANLVCDNIVSTQNYFIGNGAALININAENIEGVLSVKNGGTGCNSIPEGELIFGNGTKSVITSPNVVWDNENNVLTVSGTTLSKYIQGSFIGDGKYLSNINAENIVGVINLYQGGTGCNLIPQNHIVVGNDGGSGIITSPNLTWDNILNRLNVLGNLNATNIQATNYTGDGFNLTNINPANLTNFVGVGNGGTGCNSLPIGELLVGNRTNSVITSPNLKWDNTINELSILGDIYGNEIQGSFIGNGLNISNINPNNINGVLNIIQGGTGCNVIPYGYIPVGNYYNSIITTPNFVWSNIENKLYVKGSIFSENVQGLLIGDGINLSNINGRNIIGVVSVENGGTGCNSIPYQHLLIGNDENAIITTPNLIWNNFNDTLIVKGDIDAYKLNTTSLFCNRIQGHFEGDGYNLSNINLNNIYGTLTTQKGGTGCNSLPIGELLIGNNNKPVITTPNLVWDNTLNELTVKGTVYSDSIKGGFIGDGIFLSNINANNIIGVISIENGGTGCNIIPEGELIIGNDDNAVITTPNLKWMNNELNVNGNIYSSTIQGSLYGDGFYLSNINADSINGIISLKNGGTGCNVIPYGELLIGNNENGVITSPNLIWSNIENKLIVKGLTLSDRIQGSFIGDGINLSNIIASNIYGQVSVLNGGTGCNILPIGNVLVGNNEGSLITSPNFVWDNTLNTLNIKGSLYANNIQGLLYGDGINISNIIASNIIGILTVPQGGTGCNTIPQDELVIGNDNEAIITTPNLKWNNVDNILTVLGITESTIVQGAIYGDGKYLSNINADNIVGVLSVSQGGTGCNTIPYGRVMIGNDDKGIITTPNFIWDNITNNLVIKGYTYSDDIQGLFIGDGYNISNLRTNSLIGVLSVVNGGTGCNILPVGELLVGNNDKSLITSPNLNWNNTQNKLSVLGDIYGNNIQGSLYGDGRNISNIVASNIIGVLQVPNGGTGCNIIPQGEIVIGNDNNGILTTPKLYWNESTNELQILGSVYGNNIQGNLLGNGLNISNIIASNIIGVLTVPYGGTGCNVISSGELLIGSDGEGIITTPSLVWNNEEQKLNVGGVIITSNIEAYTITTDFILSDNTQGKFYGDGNELSNINPNNIIGIVKVENGGTGCNLLPSGQIVVGNNTNSVITTPELSWNNISKQLLVDGTVHANIIQGMFVGDGSGLSNVNIDNLVGSVIVERGGTGCNILPYGEILVGNNTSSVITSPGFKWDNNENRLIVSGKVEANELLGDFYGNFYGINLDNFVGSNIIGTVLLQNGGTGCNVITEGQILVGNNGDAVITSPNFTWDNNTDQLNVLGVINASKYNGLLYASNIEGEVLVRNGGTGCNVLPLGELLVGNNDGLLTTPKLKWNEGTETLEVLGNIVNTTTQSTTFIGDGSGLTNVNINNIVGIIGTANGGTGKSSFTKGNVLIGNGTNPIDETSKLFWDENTNVFTIDGGLSVSYIQGKFIGDGSGLSNVQTEDIVGILPVSKGGIGTTYFSYGQILYGNDGDRLLSSPDLIWNNIYKLLIINGDIEAKNIYADNIHTLVSSNFIGEIVTVNGGTGCNSIPYGEIMVGNNESGILTSPNFVWSNISQELLVRGHIVANNIQGHLIGDGLNISNIVASNIIGVLDVRNGGTGCNLVPLGHLMIGNNNEAIITTPELLWDNIEKELNVAGNIYANYVRGALYGDGRNISNIVASNLLTGTVDVENGGTGCNILPYGRLLVGNDFEPVITSSKLAWSNIEKKLVVDGKIYSDILQGDFIGNAFELSNIVASNFVGVLEVSNGGTGCNILPIGNVLVGNNRNAIITSSNLLWNNETNTLKISGSLYTNNIENDVRIVSRDLQGNFIGDGTNISNLVASNIIGILSVENGGTGSNSFTYNEVLLGNDERPLKTLPNLKWDEINEHFLVDGTIVASITQGKFYGDGTNISNFVASNLLGQIPVSLGGTGCNIIPYGQLIMGNNDEPIITTPYLRWDNDSNILDVTGDVFVNNIRVDRNIVAGSLPPSKFIGDALNVSNFVASNILGLIAVENGGTGRTSLNATQILVGNDSGPILTSSDFVWNNSLKILVVAGTIYTSDLSAGTFYSEDLVVLNKMTVDESIHNKITGNEIQGKFYGDGTHISNFVGSNLIGVVSVINGGTGCNSIPQGHLLIGNNEDAIITTPDLHWNKDTKRLTVEGDLYAQNMCLTENVYSSIKVQGAFYGDGKNISNIVASNLIGPGIIAVQNGGTGYSSIPDNQILVGNGGDTIFTTANFNWNDVLNTLNINGTIYTNDIIAANALYCTNLNITNELTTFRSSHGSIISDSVQGRFLGDGTNISNIIGSNLVGIVLVENGGTGCNILPKGKILIGNNTDPITTISDLEWDEINKKLTIGGDIFANNAILSKDITATNVQGAFYGDGVNISNIIASNLVGPGIIAVENGGTGYSSITKGYILAGNDGDTLLATPNLRWDNDLLTLTTNGIIYTNNAYASSAIYSTNMYISDDLTVDNSVHKYVLTRDAQGAFIGDGTNISNLSGNSLIGITSVSNGGTGCNVLPKGKILIGNDDKPINTLSELEWDNVNKILTVLGDIITNNIHSSNSIYSDRIQGKIYGDGGLLSNIGANSLTGVINVVNGGTGLSEIPSTQLLIGNGTNTILTSANLAFQNDTLFVNGTINTNLLETDTSIFGSIINVSESLYANSASYEKLSSVSIQGKFYGDGTNISNIVASNLIGVLSVISGGTGCNVLPKGYILIGNDTNPVSTLGDLYWDENNKSLSINGDIYANNIINIGDLYSKNTQGTFYGDGANISNLVASNIIGSGLLNVSYGGTGRNSLDSTQILIGNGTDPITTTQNFTWNNALNNLVTNGIIYTNTFIASNSIYTTNTNITNSLNVNNKATIKQLYTQTTQGAFTGDGLNISNLVASNIVGVLNVPNGGTGCNIIPEGYIVVGNDSDPIYASGSLYWDKNNNNLIVDGSMNINDIIASGDIYAFKIQGDFYGDGTNISNLVASNIIGSGIIPVVNGGTGYSSIPANQILIGNDSSALTTSSSFIWDETFSSLNINGTIYTTNLNVDVSMFTTTLNVISEIAANIGSFNSIYSDTIQGKYYGDGFNLSNLDINNITGTITVVNGGTGCNIIPKGQLLVGNNDEDGIYTTPKLHWDDDINKLLVDGNLTVEDINVNNLFINTIQGLLYGDGTNLSNIVASNIIGNRTISVSEGGTGNSTLPIDRLLLGNNTDPITTSGNLLFNANSLYVNGTIYTNILEATSYVFATNTNIINELFVNIGNHNKVIASSVQGILYGDGTNISNIAASNLIGLVNVEQGGTGCNILPIGELLVGNNTNPIITTPNLFWNNDTLNILGTINVSNLEIKDSLIVPNIETSNISTIGWDINNREYIGIKYNNTPFYVSLYLTNNIISTGTFAIPFTVNYANNGGMPSSSLNIEPSNWNVDHFIPPEKGIYSITYSVCCSDKCYIWLNKSNDFSNSYDNRFGMQNSVNDNGCSTTLLINTTTTDNWYFVVSNTGTTVFIENSIIGNTKASINLIQSIM